MISGAQPDVFVPAYRRVLLEAFAFDDYPDLPFVLLSKVRRETLFYIQLSPTPNSFFS
jgi:hypothetical protein